MSRKSLQLLDSWLPRTETFIWQTVRKLKRFPPVVMADRFENLESFPLPSAEFLDIRASRPMGSRLWARLVRSYAQVRYPSTGLETRSDLAVIHVHKGFRALVTRDFTRAMTRATGAPLLVSFYGSDVSQQAFLRRARGGYRELFEQARFLLAEGPALRQRLIDLGARADKVRIQRIAIDPADYPFRERSWDGIRPVKILFVGRFVDKKGLDVGLRALADARVDFPWTLTVIGDGPRRAALAAQVERLGMSGRVDFVGYKTLMEMRAALTEHDLLLQPSCTAPDGDSEGGAPTVLLEAQACGLPIVSTTHADIPYVTVPESSWLAPEGDAEALAELLRRAGRESQRWAEMGHAGRAHVIAQHNVHREASLLEDLYEEACL